MTPILRARSSIGSVCLSAVALLGVACGASNDDGASGVPAFAGAPTPPGASPAALPSADDPDGSGAMPGGMPAAAVPTSGTEAPGDGIALAPASPATDGEAP